MSIVGIELHNFLSWGDAYIPIGPLTVLHGSNLSGKTNATRGIIWALYNDATWSDEPAKDCIRRLLPIGECIRNNVPIGSLAPEVSVTVHFSDGRKVTRFRSTKENKYLLTHPDGSVDEIPTGSVGAGFCEDVGEFTGIKPTVWPDGGKQNLQVSNDAIEGRFLLADSTAAVDSKLGVVLGLDTVEVSTKTASTKAISAGKARTKIEEQITEKQSALAQYDGLDIAIAAHRTASERVSAYEATLTRLNSVSTLKTRLEQAEDVCSRIGDIPEQMDALIVQAEQSMKLAEQAERNRLTVKKLISKLSIDDGPTDEQLEAYSAAIDAAEEAHTRSEAAARVHKQVYDLCAAGTKHSAAAATAANEIEATNEELEALMSSITVCPVDGEPHEQCPFCSECEEAL
jgi:hypothetical protein